MAGIRAGLHIRLNVSSKTRQAHVEHDEVRLVAFGHTEQDDVVMVEVVTETFDRGWWRTYSATLAERFHQQKIHVRAVRVEMLDEDEM